MPSRILTPKPQNFIPVSTIQADGAEGFLVTGGFTFAQPLHNFGTFLKGVGRTTIWLLYEVPVPIGTQFAEFSFGMEHVSQVGTLPLPIWIGFLETDGVWNAGEDGLGWKEYALLEDLPHPNSDTDSLWLDASPSLKHDVSPTDHSVGDFVKWGTNSPGLSYEDPKFLTDFQTAFDENEIYRTSRGVPVAMMLVPRVNDLMHFQFFSANQPDHGSGRVPELFFRTRRIHIV